MRGSCDSRPAEAVLGEIATWGPYFEVELHDPDEASDIAPWQPIAAALDPAAVRDRIEATRAGLIGPTPTGAAHVQARVAASVTHLGLLARLLSPRIGAAALGLLLSTGTSTERCIPTPGTSFPLSLPEPDIARAAGAWSRLPAPARAQWAQALVTGVADPVREAIDAVVRLPARVARGNVASAIHGSLDAAAWTRGGAPDPRHLDCVSELLSTPLLASSWRGQVGQTSFRRVSCCLLYRAHGRADHTQVCGDCVLRS